MLTDEQITGLLDAVTFGFTFFGFNYEQRLGRMRRMSWTNEVYLLLEEALTVQAESGSYEGCEIWQRIKFNQKVSVYLQN